MKKLKEYTLKFGPLGYIYYFNLGKTSGMGFTIGPSTFGRTKYTLNILSKKHWSNNANIKTRWLPFNLSLIGIDFGKTYLPYSLELVFGADT